MSAAAARKGYRGYVSSRPFGGYSIPVPLQSLALRDYCSRKGMLYVLPLNENSFPNSYLVLEGLIVDLDGYEGIVMPSMHMMPTRAERRRQIYRRVLDQGCSLHLVLEDLIFQKIKDIDRVEELLLITRMAKLAPSAAELA